MNREIKFRFIIDGEAWDEDGIKNNGDMYIEYMYGKGLVVMCYVEDGYAGRYDEISSSFEQYIGLKDIDGNEIFQNDICEVMYYTPFGDKTNDYYGKWVVTKWMGQFVLVSGKERIGFADFSDVVSSEYVSNLGTVCELSDTVNVRVIGNTHQNPELLK